MQTTVKKSDLKERKGRATKNSVNFPILCCFSVHIIKNLTRSSVDVTFTLEFFILSYLFLKVILSYLILVILKSHLILCVG